MGTSIFMLTEIKKDGEWERIPENPKKFELRNYSIFALFANVHNHFGYDSFAIKGLPKDTKCTYFEVDEDFKMNFNSIDLHSHSFLTLEELINFNYDSYFSHKYKMSKDFYDDFIKFGGKLPKEMVVKEYNPTDFSEIVRFAFEPTVLVQWQDTESDRENSDLHIGINQLKEIAQKYDIENYADIRIIFAFD